MLPPTVLTVIDLALEEDLGRGDVTCRLTVPRAAQTEARVVAKQELVLSGLDVFAAVMRRVDGSLEVQELAACGASIRRGEVVAKVAGSTASILMAERVALNFLQRLCGIATTTANYVAALPKHSKTRITDTRKTTPGLRYLERRAVLDGGGFNHRADLSGGVLIKENHIASAGSIAAAVAAARAGAPHPLRIEIEVQSRQELELALAAGAEAVLLDNMSKGEVEACVTLAAGRAFIEASGGITLENVGVLAEAGVDAISVGALTHSVRAADLSLLIQGA
ncbi:MAG: carboxylating nicotinate-nucleotide diphosphorylase [Myxococcota bacterium]|jgi:nicotinate-nucleotide pyrophosphorylase (carboxylating)|nr:carboxylating nicotinate-nucleotide diphosphorylase [Myxococcota bacterium]